MICQSLITMCHLKWFVDFVVSPDLWIESEIFMGFFNNRYHTYSESPKFFQREMDIWATFTCYFAISFASYSFIFKGNESTLIVTDSWTAMVCFYRAVLAERASLCTLPLSGEAGEAACSLMPDRKWTEVRQVLSADMESTLDVLKQASTELVKPGNSTSSPTLCSLVLILWVSISHLEDPTWPEGCVSSGRDV